MGSGARLPWTWSGVLVWCDGNVCFGFLPLFFPPVTWKEEMMGGFGYLPGLSLVPALLDCPRRLPSPFRAGSHGGGR